MNWNRNRRSFLVASGTIGIGLAIGARLQADEKKADEKKKEPSSDLKNFQGEWVAKDEMGESTWTFKENRLSLKAPSRAYEMTIQLDNDAKPERSIDFQVLESSPNAKGAKALGIYKFEGEAIWICFGAGDVPRPKEFKNDFPNGLLFKLNKK
ncbi:MAG: hypothetical protein NVSMB9_14210 [Isosphaeraceae bacterium]